VSGIVVEHDQTSDSVGVIGGVNPRKRSPNRIGYEKELGLGSELMENRVEVFGDLSKIMSEWSDICGVRILSETIELGITIVGKKAESTRTLESASES
jgi:hypothetical protein